MAKWVCSRCSFIYSEEKGDGERGVQPNTPFDKLPESWVCPKCKKGKDVFKKME